LICLSLLLTLSIIFVTTSATTLHASKVPANDDVFNQLFGTLPCSEQHPCNKKTKFGLTYDTTQKNNENNTHNENEPPVLIGAAFSGSFYHDSTREHIANTAPVSFKQDTTKSNIWNTIDVLVLENMASDKPITTPIFFILQVERLYKLHTSSRQFTTMSITWTIDGIAPIINSVQLHDGDALFTVANQNLASAHVLLGPYIPDVKYDPISSVMPYDNRVKLDFDLSWLNWDQFMFDKISIFPTGSSWVNTEKYSTSCLFGGQFVNSVELAQTDDDKSYFWLEINGLKEIIHRNGASFNGPSQLQLQCIFDIQEEQKDWVKQPLYSHGFDLILHLEGNEKNILANPVISFGPPGHGLKPITVTHVPENTYIDSIGDTPSEAIQSRFNHIIDQSKMKMSVEKSTEHYMSYYNIQFPLSLPPTLHGIKFVLNSIRHWKQMTVLLTGFEMKSFQSLDYAHVFIRCISPSAHNNVVRSHTALYGHYDVNTRQPSGPGENQVSITNPDIKVNEDFIALLPKTDQEYAKLPICSDWSVDLNIGVYNENIPQEMIDNSAKYAFGIRLRHQLMNDTDIVPRGYLRHDWISSYDMNSQSADEVPNHNERFVIHNVQHVKAKKNSKDVSYLTFEMVVDTTGIKKTDDIYPETMDFNLSPIGGSVQWFLPLEKDEQGFDKATAPIQCNLKYQKDGKQVEKTTEAFILNDIKLIFENIGEDTSVGLPYNTKDINIKCPNLRLRKINENVVDKAQPIGANIALSLPTDTFVRQVEGAPFNPHHGGRTFGKIFSLFLLWVLITFGVFALLFICVDYATTGKISGYWNTVGRNRVGFGPRLPTYFADLARDHSGSKPLQSDDDFNTATNGAGNYGSYQDVAVN
jgi:hypothetical protein